MNKANAKKIIEDVALEYLGSFWKEKLSTGQSEIWLKELCEWDYKKAQEARIRLFQTKPAYKNLYNGHMPDFKDFREIYQECVSPTLPDCPCCDNRRWVYIADKCKPCDCAKNQGLPIKCANPMECNPSENLLCPLGPSHHKAKRDEGIKAMKDDPAFKRGLSFLEGGRIKKMLADKGRTKKMERVSEIPF
jgi:hypothetical protein